MERKIDKKKNSGTGIAQDASEVEKVKNYIYTYLKSADFTARTCKTAYIRDEHHERIQHIVHIIGKNKITLSGYIDNVLAEHFASHKDEMTKLYELSKPIFSCKDTQGRHSRIHRRTYQSERGP